MKIKNIKSYMMPISMFVGVVFCTHLSMLSFITPFLIFFMLLITYSNIPIRSVRFSMLHLWLLLIQLVGCVLVYVGLYKIDTILAQSAMICILAPTATSAVVITGMLGGNTSSLISYSLLSNLSVALIAPFLFTIVGNQSELSFWVELREIMLRIFVLLLAPLFAALLIAQVSPKAHKKIRNSQSYSFYLWNLALIVATARTVDFLLVQGSSHIQTSLLIFGVTLGVCSLQFYIGRRLGKHYNDTIAGGQGLGQKNTILAIWMAQTYLNPLSSIGPGAYILWQNVINSTQVWYKQRRN